MFSTMTVANQERTPKTLPALLHADAVARLASVVAAMNALDRQMERCTDPLAESCLLTLRGEREVAYLETLYAWEYEATHDSVLH